jgi:hypothetical protein
MHFVSFVKTLTNVGGKPIQQRRGVCELVRRRDLSELAQSLSFCV